ncbi:MAG: class I SAM-dependent methyltransferase [Gammaproteobacteria bacterium]|nr:class I SAM-dependent methyltransferase [Gammaproteobacteria bacterium]MCK5262379.1 class I SAM-dependent methyltransferase [Gammaproteobacteria bacterium]
MPNNQHKTSLCIICDNDTRHEQASSFAADHQLPLLNKQDDTFELQLIFGDERIELYDRQLNTSIYVDFVSGALAHRQQFGGGRGQAIAKAIGLKQGKNPEVLDVTAGLARDAYILATLGCHITLVEQSPILCALIEDGMKRGLENEQSAQILSGQFELHNQNAIDYMSKLDEQQRADVIYIDPMYPERKKSALVKKDMQILQRLLGKNKNDGELLDAALNCARERVVVKRPSHAPCLTETKPATSINSKKTRYDIYLTKSS